MQVANMSRVPAILVRRATIYVVQNGDSLPSAAPTGGQDDITRAYVQRRTTAATGLNVAIGDVA